MAILCYRWLERQRFKLEQNEIGRGGGHIYIGCMKCIAAVRN